MNLNFFYFAFLVFVFREALFANSNKISINKNKNLILGGYIDQFQIPIEHINKGKQRKGQQRDPPQYAHQSLLFINKKNKKHHYKQWPKHQTSMQKKIFKKDKKKLAKPKNKQTKNTKPIIRRSKKTKGCEMGLRESLAIYLDRHTCVGSCIRGCHVTRASWEMVKVPERFVKEMEIRSPGSLYRSWGGKGEWPGHFTVSSFLNKTYKCSEVSHSWNTKTN